MTTTELQLPIPIDELRAVLLRNGVKKASVFGSYARGEATSESDLDLLVELADGKNYLDLGGLQYELENQYSIKADIVLEGTLRKRIQPYVEREKVLISL
ncbi:MAG TPA: nucleotidyltransferase family protein [Candidatus Dormibacteraeota bacterium]|nr:nucleotidyltransferase family protein [Candidatus Dormibacteraeota bacterium]